jgi:hypothetical protein
MEARESDVCCHFVEHGDDVVIYKIRNDPNCTHTSDDATHVEGKDERKEKGKDKDEEETRKPVLLSVCFKLKQPNRKTTLSHDVEDISTMEWKNLVKAVKNNKYGAIERCNKKGGFDIEAKGDQVKFTVASTDGNNSCYMITRVPSTQCLPLLKTVYELSKKYQ